MTTHAMTSPDQPPVQSFELHVPTWLRLGSAIARRKGLPREEAKDVAHNRLARVLRDVSWAPTSSCGSTLLIRSELDEHLRGRYCRAVINKSIDFHRRNHRRNQYLERDDDAGEPEARPDPEAGGRKLEAGDVHARFVRALVGLKPLDQRILLLDIHGRAHGLESKEIYEGILGIPRGTWDTRLKRAKDRLCERMDKSGNDGMELAS